MSSPKQQQHRLIVTNPKAPVIEIDAECAGVYVRFSSKDVAKTLERTTDGMVVTLDLDKDGQVVGIEGLGCEEFSISALLKAANVRTERIDFSKARWRATSRHPREAVAA